MRVYLLAIAVAFVAGSPAVRADAIPEPDAILYGTLSIDRMAPKQIELVMARLSGGSGTILQTCQPERISDSQMLYILRLHLKQDGSDILNYVYMHDELEQFTPVTNRIDVWIQVEDQNDILATPQGIRLSSRGEIRQVNLSLINDQDQDGLPDGLERSWGLNPGLDDTDGDGLPDIFEVAYDGDNTSYNPYNPVTGEGTDLNATSKDTDLDGILDGWEVKHLMNPIASDLDLDYDLDGYTNWEEFLRNSEPNDPNVIPAALTIYVDDDGEFDPNHGDPLFSDPNEGWFMVQSLNDPNGGNNIQQFPIEEVQEALKNHPFDSIQEAVDFAITEDTICVKEGKYTGLGNREIDPLGKAIHIVSESAIRGPGHCVIDCEFQGRGFNFTQGEDHNTVVEGFTVLHGYADRGGGILFDGSSPTIRHCIIAKCLAQADGGGICCIEGADPNLEHINVVANDANGLGGGLYIGPGCDVILSHSILWNNFLLGDVETIQNIWLDDNGVNRPEQATIMALQYCALNADSVYCSISTTLDCNEDMTIFQDPNFADIDANDFHLLSSYGRWAADPNDPNRSTWIYTDDVYSPLIDMGDPSRIGNEIWPHGLRINIGAYGGTREASLSGSQAGQAEDLNNDGVVDQLDLERFLSALLEPHLPDPADLNKDGVIDQLDRDILEQAINRDE